MKKDFFSFVLFIQLTFSAPSIYYYYYTWFFNAKNLHFWSATSTSFKSLHILLSSFIMYYLLILCILDIFFPSNHNIHKSSCGHCVCVSDPLIDGFYWSLWIKGSEVQNKGHTNFYECCDLTKKVYLVVVIY